MQSLIARISLFAAISIANPVLGRQSDGNLTKTTLPIASATTLPSTDSTIDVGGFCNTVFNTDAFKSPGFPNTTWDSLTANGVSNFGTLSLSPHTEQY